MIKISKVIAFGVFAATLLTGCAKALSVDDQVKLVEYDNCIEHRLSEKVGDTFEPYESYLSVCEKYKP